ncbi:MAG: DUF192 domain-containing protein [Elusimicrobiales bacterium]|jgi:hypothetical protein|nr:DUF192 domain-containing protein [Elusimicrobiales bacterium]
MIFRRKSDGLVIADRAEKAETFRTRLLGLIPRKSLAAGEGLWLEPCTGIHTCFMSFPIDAVFLDRDLKVLRMERCMRPWRLSAFVEDARSVLELPSGGAAGLAEGDELETA